MNNAMTLLLAYVMVGMGLGILVKAAGGPPEMAAAAGVAVVCAIELVKQAFKKP